MEKHMDSKKDTSCRKWMITINNPLDKGFTHEKIKEVLSSIRSLVLQCTPEHIKL